MPVREREHWKPRSDGRPAFGAIRSSGRRGKITSRDTWALPPLTPGGYALSVVDIGAWYDQLRSEGLDGVTALLEVLDDDEERAFLGAHAWILRCHPHPARHLIERAWAEGRDSTVGRAAADWIAAHAPFGPWLKLVRPPLARDRRVVLVVGPPRSAEGRSVPLTMACATTDGSILAVASGAGVFAWDGRTGEVIRRLGAAGWSAYLVACDDGRVLWGSRDGSIHLEHPRVATGRLDVTGLETVEAVAHLGGDLVAVSLGLEVHVVDARSGEMRQCLLGDGEVPISWLNARPDGRLVGGGQAFEEQGWDGRLVATTPAMRFTWDLSTGQRVAVSEESEEVSAQGRVAVDTGGTVSVRDSLRDAGPAAADPVDPWEPWVGLGPDGPIVSNGVESLYVFGRDGVLLHAFPRGRLQPVRITPLSDGRVAVAGDRLRILDAWTGRWEAVLEGHESPVSGMVALEDGRLLTAAPDRTLRVWNTQDGVCTRRIDSHVGTFGPSVVQDRYAVSSGPRHTEVWDLDEGTRVGAWRGTYSRFRPLGGDRLAATVFGSGATEILSVPSGKVVARLDGEALVRCGPEAGFVTWSPRGGIRHFDRDGCELGRVRDTLGAPLAISVDGLVATAEDDRIRVRRWGAEAVLCEWDSTPLHPRLLLFLGRRLFVARASSPLLVFDLEN